MTFLNPKLTDRITDMFLAPSDRSSMCIARIIEDLATLHGLCDFYTDCAETRSLRSALNQIDGMLPELAAAIKEVEG